MLNYRVQKAKICNAFAYEMVRVVNHSEFMELVDLQHRVLNYIVAFYVAESMESM